MIRVELTEEVVRRILTAALQGARPGPYRVRLGLKAAKQITAEAFEREMAEIAAHYAPEAR